MNLDDSDDEYEAGTDDDDDDDEEDGAKKKPNALVVRRWKMILPKRGEVGTRNMFFFRSNLHNNATWILVFSSGAKNGGEKVMRDRTYERIVDKSVDFSQSNTSALKRLNIQEPSIGCVAWYIKEIAIK